MKKKATHLTWNDYAPMPSIQEDAKVRPLQTNCYGYKQLTENLFQTKNFFYIYLLAISKIFHFPDQSCFYHYSQKKGSFNGKLANSFHNICIVVCSLRWSNHQIHINNLIFPLLKMLFFCTGVQN